MGFTPTRVQSCRVWRNISLTPDNAAKKLISCPRGNVDWRRRSQNGFYTPWVRSRRVWRSLYLQLQIMGWKNRIDIEFFIKSQKNREGKNTIVTSLKWCNLEWMFFWWLIFLAVSSLCWAFTWFCSTACTTAILTFLLMMMMRWWCDDDDDTEVVLDAAEVDEQHQQLTHPTAERPRAPSRRPPSIYQTTTDAALQVNITNFSLHLGCLGFFLHFSRTERLVYEWQCHPMLWKHWMDDVTEFLDFTEIKCVAELNTKTMRLFPHTW